MITGSDLWLAVAGALAGSVNAAAGGGSLLSFPSLIGVGLSPIAANATSTVGLLPGGYGSLWGYRRELPELRREAWQVGPPSVLGGVLGAWLLLYLGGRVFAAIVPALLVVAAALLALQPVIGRAMEKRRAGAPPTAPHPYLVMGASFLVSVYGGYFGAGQGILFLAIMGAIIPRPIGEVNVLKVLCANLNNTCAALTFVVLEALHPTGALVFRDALPVAVGSVLGGYFGVKIVRRVPAPALRTFAAGVGIAIAIYLIVKR